jgi:hypothetical protein
VETSAGAAGVGETALGGMVDMDWDCSSCCSDKSWYKAVTEGAGDLSLGPIERE